MSKIFFLDFEASSLATVSHPIEIGWVDGSGQGETYLIKPAPDWHDWSSNSEAVHGISRERLEIEGIRHDRVARRAAAALAPERGLVFSDQPGFDGPWLRVLLASAGLPHIAVLDVVQLYGAACRPLLERFTPDEAKGRALRIVAEAEHAKEMRGRTRHRALPDAEGLWWTWREIDRRVQVELGQSDVDECRSS